MNVRVIEKMDCNTLDVFNNSNQLPENIAVYKCSTEQIYLNLCGEKKLNKSFV